MASASRVSACHRLDPSRFLSVLFFLLLIVAYLFTPALVLNIANRHHNISTLPYILRVPPL
jgi:hypothetical protein